MPIHPTAIISPKAELDSTVEVGPNVVIEEHVKVGAGTRIWANAYLTGHTEIGRDNEIHMGAVIGHEPQDLKFDRTCRSYLKIGDRNVFRDEDVGMHRGAQRQRVFSAAFVENLVAPRCLDGPEEFPNERMIVDDYNGCQSSCPCCLKGPPVFPGCNTESVPHYSSCASSPGSGLYTY